MEEQIPQLIEVEQVKKGKVRFKVQWSDLYYKYDFSDWYQIQYAANKEFEDAIIKEIRETKKNKGEREIYHFKETGRRYILYWTSGWKRLR